MQQTRTASIRIGITGHRHLNDPAIIANAIKLKLDFFRVRFGADNLVAVSPMAAGADSIFAEEASKLGIPVEVILPFEFVEYAKDFNEEDEKKLRKFIADKEKIIINTSPPETKAQRDKGYLETGKWVVDNCSVLIAVWDRQPAKGKGGTADIVEYAETKGRELHIINAGPTTITSHFDEAAKKNNSMFRVCWILGIFFALTAAVLLIIKRMYQSFNPAFIWENLEFFSLVISIPLLYVAFLFKKKHISFRRNNEMLRIEQLYEKAGIAFLENNDTDVLGFETGEINFTGYAKLTEADFQNAKDILYDFAQNQLAYHNRRIETYSRNVRITEKFLLFLKAIFFTLITIHFFISLRHEFFSTENGTLHYPEATEFILLFVPTLFAAIEGIKFFNNWTGNIKASRYMVNVLDYMMNQTISCTGQNKFFRLALLFRSAYNRENINWKKKISSIAKKLEAKP